MDLTQEYKKSLFKLGIVLGILMSVYFAVKIISDLKSYDTIGSSNINSMSFSGHGEVKAVPDIANISFTLKQESKTVKEAQGIVTGIETKVLKFLSDSKIDTKDIKTTNSSFYPKYDYSNYCANAYPHPCDPSKPKITGYEVSEAINVKIRNTGDVGKIIDELGKLGVSELSGPNFVIDKEDALKAEARKNAIDDAKEKAEKLAKDLGIRLGKITSFNENGNYPMPMMYAEGAMSKSADTRTPSIPKGENTISSDVTITYEIR